MDIKLISGMLLFTLVFSNNMVLFQLIYVFSFIAIAIYTFLSNNSKRNKFLFIILYAMIMTFQTVFNSMVTFSENSNIFTSIISRIIGSIMVLMPLFVYKIINEHKSARQYLPSVQDLTVFTFNELIENINTVKKIVVSGKGTFSRKNMEELLNDLPRHNSFRYINKGSLTESYFESAYQSLDDLNIYIIISNTGSPASEFISFFTKKQYSHVSLSFDRELKTIISYNGGEKLYPPGLNMEMVKYFNKKEDSSIIVYSLPITAEKKRTIVEKIKEINEQGNAYNLFGIILKSSFKPNILFCSQFVYKMLKLVGINYFEKEDGKIKPTDLIELDYERKLKYEYKIKFNEI